MIIAVLLWSEIVTRHRVFAPVDRAVLATSMGFALPISYPMEHAQIAVVNDDQTRVVSFSCTPVNQTNDHR